MKTITECEYQEARENNTGWCVNCEDFTREDVEPDAEGYACPECEELTVHGVELALVAGDFDVG